MKPKYIIITILFIAYCLASSFLLFIENEIAAIVAVVLFGILSVTGLGFILFMAYLIHKKYKRGNY